MAPAPTTQIRICTSLENSAMPRPGGPPKSKIGGFPNSGTTFGITFHDAEREAGDSLGSPPRNPATISK